MLKWHSIQTTPLSQHEGSSNSLSWSMSYLTTQTQQVSTRLPIFPSKLGFPPRAVSLKGTPSFLVSSANDSGTIPDHFLFPIPSPSEKPVVTACPESPPSLPCLGVKVSEQATLVSLLVHALCSHQSSQNIFLNDKYNHVKFLFGTLFWPHMSLIIKFCLGKDLESLLWVSPYHCLTSSLAVSPGSSHSPSCCGP